MTGAEVTGYPADWEADVVLRDGATAHLRPIRPDDADRLRRFHDAQSPHSTYLRFFAPKPHLSDSDVRRFTTVDHEGRVALVVTVAGEILGVGRYERLDEPAATAEVAFNISDGHQGRGIGSILLEHLAAAALERGIRHFEAVVLPENARMLSVFREAGYDVRHRLADGVVTVDFDPDPTDRSLAVMAAREHRAEARSMQALLDPRSVVLVGVSARRPWSLGRRLLDGLIAGRFTGEIAVVHRSAATIAGRATHASLEEVPGAADGTVDLAVVAVPAAEVVDVVARCAQRGVRGVVVVSGGFAESGADGARLQAEVVRTARSLGVRVLGPNSFGLLNTDPSVRLNASIAPSLPREGGLALFSQSGALGVAILASADRRGLGISSFVSAGNRADVSGNDCLQYWLDDDRTGVVGLYLESVGNPRKFSRLARAVARRKPVIVVHSGSGGQAAPPGHETRHSSAPPEVLDAMLRQAGVIRSESLRQLFDVAQVLTSQPLPLGDRVAIVGNSAALGTLAAAACESWRLQVVGVPRSVPFDAPLEDVAALVAGAQADPGCDAVVACLVPPFAGRIGDLDGVVRSVPDRTTVACVMESRFLGGADGTAPVPGLPLPEDAVRALASVVRYAQWSRHEPGGPVPREWAPLRSGGDRLVGGGATGAAPRQARALIADVLVGAPQGRDLTDGEVADLLLCYGLRLAPPGGGEAGEVPGAVACRVRTAEDPLFGPLVSFALAGETAQLLGDVAYRVPPLDVTDVADLVRGIRGAPMLFGHGGREPVDITAVETVVGRLSLLAEDLPQVRSLVVDPLVAHPGGALLAAATAAVAPAPGRTDSGRRALPAATG